MTLHPFLSRLVELGDLSGEERQAIADACGPAIKLAAHAKVVEAGDIPGYSVALLSGLVARVNDLPDGRRQILSFQIPGDGVDLYGYALKRLDHTVVTLTPCTITRIPHAVMDDLVVRFPHLALTLWRETILDASIMREQLVRVGQRPALERTANLFCEMAHRFESVGLGSPLGFPFPVTQQTLASALGMSLIHVNRVLRQLREAKLINLSRTRLVILDRAGLEAVGQFDPRYLETIRLHRSSAQMRAGAA